MEKGNIYQGRAPEPARKIVLETSSGAQVQVPATSPEGVEVGELIAIPAPSPSFAETAPPVDTEGAVKASTNEDRIGELTRALGEQKKDHALAMQEMALKHDSQMAVFASQSGTDGASVLPKPIDPNQNVKAGELMGILEKIMPYLEEKITRSGWDITPDEEAAVLADNPHFSQITDGAKRIECILKAVQLKRARNGSLKTTPGSSAPQDTSVGASNTRSLQGRVVPHVENSIAPVALDSPPENAGGQYMQRYEEAKKITNKTQRLAAMKQIYKEANASQGITDEALSKSKFTHNA